MSVVYGRKINGQETTFGTTGYTYNNIFLLYDRLTTSLWYPLEDGSFEAIGGKLRGERIEFIEKPPVMSLGDWLRLHPDTQVLLDDQESIQFESMIPDKNTH